MGSEHACFVRQISEQSFEHEMSEYRAIPADLQDDSDGGMGWAKGKFYARCRNFYSLLTIEQCVFAEPGLTPNPPEG